MRNKREKLIRSLCKYYSSGGHCSHSENLSLIEYINEETTSFCSTPEKCTLVVDYFMEEMQKLRNK